jgi:hypothetical protein
MFSLISLHGAAGKILILSLQTSLLIDIFVLSLRVKTRLFIALS